MKRRRNGTFESVVFFARRERTILTHNLFIFIRAGRIMIELDREKRDEIVKRRESEFLNSMPTSDPETPSK